jgi:phosphatidylglycerophosphate synthase
VTTELVCHYLYRPLAHLVVLALLPLRTPPPAVVLAAAASGIASAVELARGDLVAAALLLVLKTVLDNADGQLARASGRVTAFGRYLDSESDLLVNAALFAAVGYRTGRPLLAGGAFVVLTLVLSVNFNLRRLYLRERGDPAEAMPPADGAGAVLRRAYDAVYGPQDRLVEKLVEWRLGRLGAGPAARLAYHDRATIGILHNFGLSGQMSALAVCAALGHPGAYVWVVLACGLALVPLEARREMRAGRTRRRRQRT